MDWSLIAQYITQEWQTISTLEIVAVMFSVMEVLLSYRNNVLLYPSGIIACSLSIWLMGRSGLYAEAVLSLYYLVMSFYGWYKWVQRNKKAEQLAISACTSSDWRIVAGICVVSFVLLLFTLKTFTDSTVPIMDAFVSATAWAGMWLLARRKVENWILLNISNIVAIPLLFYKHLPLMSLLTVFLFIVAVLGYFRWKRIMKETALHQDSSLPDLAPSGRYPDQP
ncbi:nicotinamide riboside transporter PnuC [Taibaiella helva]|uniref:nicotinamide riboside transporter PnuC n=1 Tax=Taibaiella helva TaxID=2301235 RepID=UPI000E584A1C|nr:nicotinamide riboside transporter PnuC [Taibaiella helva]